MGKVYIGCIYPAGALVIAGAIGCDVLVLPVLVGIIGIHEVVQGLERGAQSCFQLDLGKGIGIICLHGGKRWAGSAVHFLVGGVIDGRPGCASIVLRCILRG